MTQDDHETVSKPLKLLNIPRKLKNLHSKTSVFQVFSDRFKSFSVNALEVLKAAHFTDWEASN